MGASRLRRVIESLKSMPSFDRTLVKQAVKTINAIGNDEPTMTTAFA